jgi:hypothetical protein
MADLCVRPGVTPAAITAAVTLPTACLAVTTGTPHAWADVKAHVATPEDDQSPYLIAQSGQRIVSQRIWQLGNSAANYRRSTP